MVEVTGGNIGGESFEPQPHLVPKTRPERVAHAALDAAESCPDLQPGDKIMVMVMGQSVPAALRAGRGRRQAATPAGMAFHNYSGPREVINDLLMHLVGIGKSAGLDIDPVWLDGK